jgi:hypothetical protein
VGQQPDLGTGAEAGHFYNPFSHGNRDNIAHPYPDIFADYHANGYNENGDTV